MRQRQRRRRRRQCPRGIRETLSPWGRFAESTNCWQPHNRVGVGKSLTISTMSCYLCRCDARIIQLLSWVFVILRKCWYLLKPNKPMIFIKYSSQKISNLPKTFQGSYWFLMQLLRIMKLYKKYPSRSLAIWKIKYKSMT